MENRVRRTRQTPNKLEAYHAESEAKSKRLKLTKFSYNENSSQSDPEIVDKEIVEKEMVETEKIPKKRARGRPPSQSPLAKTAPSKTPTPTSTLKPLNLDGTTPKKRGRPRKNPTPTACEQTTPKQIQTTLTKYQKVKPIYDFDDEDSQPEQEESKDSGDEFKPDNVELSEESSNVSDLSEKISSSINDESGDDSVIEVSSRSSRKLTPGRPKNTKEINSKQNLVEKFDPDEVIESWEYELDLESRVFMKPIVPALSDAAIQPYLTKKINSKCVLYNCPFCEKMFTYTLVFKNHLYSCEKNLNVPEYSLSCFKYPECSFKGLKKQEMINHFFLHDEANESYDQGSKKHANHSLTATEDSEFFPQMTKTKQNQLEVSRYYYIEKSEFKFTYDYLNKSIARNYKRLKYLTEFYLNGNTNSSYKRFTIRTTNEPKTDDPNTFNLSVTNIMNLKFQLPNEKIELKPFEVYQNLKEIDSIKLINAVDKISVLEWCPTNPRITTNQYLAFATCPSEQISSFFNPTLNSPSRDLLQNNQVINLFESPNLIYVCKFPNLACASENQQVDIFGILHQNIGHINAMKWRPDCGACISKTFETIPSDQSSFDSTFLGYLLTASSNSNGYISCIQDMTRIDSASKVNPVRHTQAGIITSVEKISVYEFGRKIVLKTNYNFGQCTSGDWSQLNGATEIALGYANGAVALFQINSAILKAQSEIYSNSNLQDLCIYPIKTFNAHTSFVRTVKWSKLNSSTLASGSIFSRDVKCWDTINVYKPFIEYEIFCTEFAFTLHSNHLFIVKEANLKGENHLYELDLSFNAFNKDRDETRCHSSLFYTHGSMTSIDQTDYFNKFIISDSQGHVIVSSATNPEYWIAKHHLMFNSFSSVCKFDIIDTSTSKVEDQEYSFDSSQKEAKIIKVDLGRKFNDRKSKQKTPHDNTINSNHINLTNLTMIRWNTNFNYLNWYAVGSQSGFIFLQRLDELLSYLDED